MEESNEDDKKSQIKKEQVNDMLIQSSLVNANTQYKKLKKEVVTLIERKIVSSYYVATYERC